MSNFNLPEYLRRFMESRDAGGSHEVTVYLGGEKLCSARPANTNWQPELTDMLARERAYPAWVENEGGNYVYHF